MAFFGCRGDNVIEKTLERAGENRTELEKLLEHYKDNAEKLDAARFLIANMAIHYSYDSRMIDSAETILNSIIYTPGLIPTVGDSIKMCWRGSEIFNASKVYDIETVTADYLIDNIDRAFEQYKKRPWNENLDFVSFCELILPYRIGDERLTYWRQKYEAEFSHKLDSLYKGSDVIEACNIMKRLVDDYTGIYNDELLTPHRDALALLKSRVSNCRDDCDRYIYAMRACGIPVTAHHLLVSPENGTSHQWMVLWDSKSGRFLPFGYDGMSLRRDSIDWDGRKKGKIYQFKFGINRERIEGYPSHVMELDGSLLSSENIEDVTESYFGENMADVEVFEESFDRSVYLGVFAKGIFHPVDFGRHYGENFVRFKNIEPNVIYFPICRGLHGWEPCGQPFLVDLKDKVVVFSPDYDYIRPVNLTRKMPLTWRHREWKGKDILGMKFIASENGKFSCPDTLLVVNSDIQGNVLYKEVESKLKYRYIKIIPEKDKAVAGAELLFFSMDSSRPIAYEIVTKLPNTSRMKDLNDGDILTWLSTPINTSVLIRFTVATNLRKIEFSPRNDDNFVWPGQEYEMFYFDRKWISAGRKIANDHSVNFLVPAGAVYLLHNCTKGIEEQVFIYNNSTQLFSLDLPLPDEFSRCGK